MEQIEKTTEFHLLFEAGEVFLARVLTYYTKSFTRHQYFFFFFFFFFSIRVVHAPQRFHLLGNRLTVDTIVDLKSIAGLT